MKELVSPFSFTRTPAKIVQHVAKVRGISALITSTFVAQVVINGLTISMIYILMALGFNLIFGIMRIVNFAHGEFYMLGAALIYYFYDYYGLNYGLAMLLSLLLAGILGYLAEKLIFHRLRSEELNSLIASLGLSLIMANAAVIILGPESLAIKQVFSGIINIMGASLPKSRLNVIVSALVIVAAFIGFLRYTRHGQAIQAIVQDEEAAKAQGINVKLLYAVAFGAGTALAASAGALVGPMLALSAGMGHWAMIKAFVVVIIGGIGSIYGAVVGGLLLGLVESLTVTFLGSAVSDLLSFVLLIVILVIRPKGILGRE